MDASFSTPGKKTRPAWHRECSTATAASSHASSQGCAPHASHVLGFRAHFMAAASLAFGCGSDRKAQMFGSV